jgi:hypothetical protein
MTLQRIIMCALSLLLTAMPVAADAGGGRLVVDGADSVDFGEHPAGDKKTAVYILRNTGDEPLRINRIHTTCGCASVTSSRDVIEPGGTTSVEVAILPYSIAGPYSKNTFVESTAQSQSPLKLNMRGRALPLVEALPTNEMLAGRLKEGDGWQGQVSIRLHALDVVLGAAVATGSHPLRLSTNRIDKASGTVTLAVVLEPSAVSGDLLGLITIPVLHPTNHPPLLITVNGRIGDVLAVIPGVCYLQTKGDTPQRRTFTLRIPGRRSMEIAPDKVILPERGDLSIAFADDQPANLLQMTITFKPEFLRALVVEKSIPLVFRLKGVSSATLVCRVRD